MPDDIPFKHNFDFEYGVLEQVSPGIRRIVARNPGAFTCYGTGTYVIGHGKVAIVDPGPMLQEHVDALLAALRGEEVTHILITHTHLDHSPAAAPIKAALGVKSYGFGPHGGGRHAPGEQVEEGGDPDFVPDVRLAHGDIVEGAGWSVECVHTPGHTSNHLCFQLREEKALFSGDHVMGWSTSIVSPPDGDMADYLASLALLLDRDDKIYWPTHGPPVGRPRPFVRAFIGHRKLRERQILGHLEAGEGRIAAMVPLMYRDIPQALHRAAERSVFAHLIHMCETGRAVCEGELAVDARYRPG